MIIGIYGASSSTLEKEYYDEAERLGRLIAAGGHGIVYGGGREGLMGACARGVLEGGGGVTGVAPRSFDEPGILFTEKGRFIFTDTMAERKHIMEELAGGFIILPGGVGTLEELFETLTLKLLGQHDKPMVLLDTLGCYDALWELLRRSMEQGFTSRLCADALQLRSTPEEALDALFSAKKLPQRSRADYNK